MATTPKTKRPVSNTKSKVVASKKKGLSRKQWGIIATAGVLVLAIGGYFGVQYYQNSQSDAASCRSGTYKLGSRSTCVKYIQTLLNAMQSNAGHWAGNGYKGGYYVDTDGIFGNKTKENVIVLQKWYNSYLGKGDIKVDGVVGKETWSLFCQYAYHNGTAETAWQRKANAISSSALGCSK